MTIEPNAAPNVPGTRRPARFWVDLLERVTWTAAQVVLAGVTVEMFNLPGWAVPIVATGLAAAKGLVARQVGDHDTAALLPASTAR